MLFRRVAAALVCAVMVLVSAQGIPAQGPAARGTVAPRIERILSEIRSPKATCGVVAGWADEAAPFFEHDGDAALIPASNQKIITAAAAVLLLGFNHEIRTDIVAHGRLDGGVLQGALRIRGEGDPTYGARDHGETLTKLAFFAERLRARGLTRVTGPLLIDDSAFDQEFTGPDWPTSDARTTPYLGQVAALSIDDGCVRVMITPGSVGRAASLAVVPDVGHVALRGDVTTIGTKGGGVRFERGDASNDIVVAGSIARGAVPQKHLVAIHDPAMHFGRAFLHALKAAGIRVDGGLRRAEPSERQGGEILLRYGTPMSQILPAMLKESLNARAEMVAKHVGYSTGEGGTFAGAASAARRAIADVGVDGSALVLADGSGLSRRNRLTAAALHSLLAALYRHADGAQFREALAEPGEEGTLRRRFAGLDGRVFAKTGTLNGVSALSGYVRTRSGRWIAFAMLMNGADPKIRKVQDATVELLASLDGEG